jgi:hypothetical protein
MADTGVIDLDTGAVVEKRGRGRPPGSKNKPKDASLVVSSSSALVKRCPGRPLGSKNKPKLSASLASRSLYANAVCHSILLLLLLSMYSLFSLSLVLNAVSSSVCL